MSLFSLLSRTDFACQRLTRLIQTRLNQKSGCRFVNTVLQGLSLPPISSAEYESLRNEIATDRELAQRFEQRVPRLLEITPSKKITTWPDRIRYASAGVDIFYVLPRVIRPGIIVETGVASGSMTSFLLAALYHNATGVLHSFDLPPIAGMRSMDWTAKGVEEIGFLIPERYKAAWTLTIGDATYELPRLLVGKSIDVFFHDSDHSYAHMIYEYSFALKHVSPKGLLISDDITWNPAFFDFTRGTDARFALHRLNRNLGVAWWKRE
jgi:predicted O-methyltransferase YrrM